MLVGGGIITNGISIMQTESFSHKYSVNYLFLFQEHPFLFTLRNSGWQSSGNTSEDNTAVVPYWAVIVAIATGILAGSLIVWGLMAQRIRKHPKAGNTATENNSMSF